MNAQLKAIIKFYVMHAAMEVADILHEILRSTTSACVLEFLTLISCYKSSFLQPICPLLFAVPGIARCGWNSHVSTESQL